ncbi:hypothetical protein HU830_04530 [Lactobacillus sp. DCY120]|uniref:Uncharacterized protein n=1 Tax=Bombilactobacillus apium TaxID=2675299 RepID=A0A850RCD0_9LACO|nr:hypothetical protein [Bombilactobacillus apium]NVY96438.1 hypothetical protein [Bombilactobacillus apium]
MCVRYKPDRSLSYQLDFVAVLANFVHHCYQEDHLISATTEVHYLCQLRAQPEFFFYRLVGYYYEALLQQDFDFSKQIVQILADTKAEKLAVSFFK